jgi:hypothetical protein
LNICQGNFAKIRSTEDESFDLQISQIKGRITIFSYSPI